jgi:hypothetical protein
MNGLAEKHLAQFARNRHARKQRRFWLTSLPVNEPQDDEIALLMEQQRITSGGLSPQTMSFTSLPPEIRNRI